MIGILLTALPPEIRTETTPGQIDDSLPVYHLGEVIVVRSKRDIPKSSVSEISSTEMNATGADSFEEALTNTPGIIVTAGSKGESRLQLRGFSGAEIKILFDGRQVSLPYYGDLDLGSISLSNVSKIKIIKGPAGAVYGANTLGGVVNIISKRTNAGTIHQYKMSVGENSSYLGEMNYGSTYNNFDYWLSLGYNRSDGYELSDDFSAATHEDGDLRNHSDYCNVNFDGKLNYTFENKTVVSFSAGYYDSEKGVPLQTETSRPRYWEFPEWRRHYVDLGGEGIIGNSIYWKGKLYYDAYWNVLRAYGDDTYSEDDVQFVSTHDGHDLGGRFEVTRTFNDRLQNTSGFSVRKDELDSQRDTSDPWENYDAASGSLFSQFQFEATGKTMIDAGASLNWQKADAVNASTNSLDPYLGVGLSPSDHLDIHASVARTTRFPALNNLYAHISGNPELGPEKALKFEIGHTIHVTEHLDFGQDFFYNDIDGLIDRASRNDLYENLNEVVLKGIETGISYSFDKQWNLVLNHTYIDAYDDATGDRRYHTPRNKYDYHVSYRADFGLSLHHTGQYIADRLDSYLEPMPDYYLAHVKTTYAAFEQVHIFLNIRNILDKNYEEELYYPMPGRTVTAGVEYGY